MFNINNNLKKIKKEIKKTNNIKLIKNLQIKYLGKKGYINNLMKLLKTIPNKLKPKFGKKINFFKKNVLKIIKKHTKKIQDIIQKKNTQYIDYSLTGKKHILEGNLHPISITINKVEQFFNELGFETIYGPEIENTYYNFDSLNINKYHPSRTSHDTFWINKIKLLRTQTSCIQIRYMKNKKPPIKAITSGCVFRKDLDNTHTPMFHQIEGFLIDKNINLSNLKYIIKKFIFFYFGKKKKIKFIPAYFPFTEPSAEIMIKNHNNTWIEILGCGLIHTNVLKKMNINIKKYSGLAFGIGIERLIMIKYKISNIKTLYENNIQILEQF